MLGSLVLILTVAILFLAGSLIVLSMKYKKLKSLQRKKKNTLRGIIKTINSVRYGNLYERVNDEAFQVFPNLSRSVNSMIESIVDREDMIKEYQNDLNKK